MSKVEDKAVELLDKLDSLTTKYAPEVYEAAVNVAMIDGISNIVLGFIGLLFFIFTPVVVIKNKDAICVDFGGDIFDFAMFMAFGFCTMLWAASAVVAAKLFIAWNWVAIFNPELALAHKVLG